jgi:DNA-binding transcriptional LysR family regulator
MRAFQRVVEEGSFAAAARALDMSPAVVTRLVADLEHSLGTRLLHRTTRKLSLTEAGNEYGARLHAILQEIDEAEMAAAAHSKELQGTVRVLSTPTMASYFIAPNIARWRERHPRLMLDLSIDPQPLSRLEAFDLVVIAADQEFDANVIARPLGTSDLILCAAPGYLQRHGVPRTPADLTQHHYLKAAELPGQDQSGRRLRLEPAPNLAAREPLDISVAPVLRSQTFDVLQQAGLDGVGFFVASELMARPFLSSGQLVRLLPDWILGHVTAYAALPTRKFMPAKTRAFLDFLVERASALS